MGFDVSFGGAALAGLLSFLSPCVLPLVPAYLCFVAGTSLDKLIDDGQMDDILAKKVFISATAFVLGFSTVFISLGAGASFISSLLLDNISWLSKVAGAVIIVFGLHYMGLFKLSFLMREARIHVDKGPSGIVGAYIIGLAFAFGWTPCVGPILATILTIAGSQDSVAYGVTLLAVYALGLGIPFLVAAFFVPHFMSFFAKFRRHLPKVEKTAGGLLVGTGLLIFFDALGQISFYLLELFPFLAKIG